MKVLPILVLSLSLAGFASASIHHKTSIPDAKRGQSSANPPQAVVKQADHVRHQHGHNVSPKAHHRL